MNSSPIAYTSTYEDARVLCSALSSSGIRAQVRPVPVGRYPFVLEVSTEVYDRAADLAHRLALALNLNMKGVA